jgi:sugar lactone lactonase YvrE
MWTVLLARQLVIIGALTVAVASCSSSTSPTAGSLVVTVTAPSGVTPAVTVTGPNGYHMTIASTVRLIGLASGSYTITAANATSTDPIVVTPYSATVSGTPASVSAGGAAAATVTYSARAGSGGLWLVGGTTVGSNVQNAATEYTAAQLQGSSVTSPATTLQFPVTTGGNINANGLAFDARGNLWVVNDNTNTIVEYAASTLGSNGSPTPAVTLQSPSGAIAQAIAFDLNGDLWVAALNGGLFEFAASQLPQQPGDSPAPAITIGITGDQSGAPRQALDLAFDPQGNLWVTVLSSTWGLIRYPPDQQVSSGVPIPTVVITPTVPYPYFMAFDTAGNLWLADAPYGANNVDYAGAITELTAASLATSGSPTPVVKLTLPNGVNSYVTSIAFDDSGDLWYLDFTHATIGEFTASQLAASGAPTPATTITTKPFYGVALAFNPHSAALPLH